MSERESRYSTLRDYLALLRRQKWVVFAVTVAFGGAALALSASADPTYEATASTRYNDIARLARLSGGLELPPDVNPVVNAFVKADEISSLETARQVKRRLRTEFSPERLRGAISTKVDAQSFLVEITASWGDADFAADLANAFAETNVDGENERLEEQLKQTIKDLEPRTRGQVVNEGGIVNLPVFNARNTLSQVSTLQELVNQGVIALAEITRRAEVPEAQASPRTARNTVLGLIVGLALGLIAAFVRDTLDRRIRTAKDAHEEFDLPVLGRVGKTALGTTGVARSAANGAGFVSQSDIESFRILRTNMAALSPERPPRSVLVTSGLPQEGKSTVASALAAAAAAAGQRTLLVDADLRRPVLASRLGLPAAPGLSEYLGGTAEPKDILHTVQISASGADNGATEGDRMLVCIPAGNPEGEPAELLASDRCRAFLDKVSRAYDLVVVDTSPMLATADPLELAAQVESVLICVRLTTSTSEEARAVKEAIRLLPDRPTGLVVTGASASDGYYGYYGY